jgi:nitroreductase
MSDHLPLDFTELSPEAMRERATTLLEEARGRRTVREFSAKPIPDGVLEDCLRIAGTAPNGANLQPWHFAVVSDPEKKREIRLAAEEEEREFYQTRATKDWLDALAPLGTDSDKPFLETAPALIAIFAQPDRPTADGEGRTPNYYAKESVGIATGLLIGALHHCGLASLTHTPSPMGFLTRICGRPSNEKPFLLLVVGYPADDASYPAVAAEKKPLEQMASFL